MNTCTHHQILLDKRNGGTNLVACYREGVLGISELKISCFVSFLHCN